MKTLRSAGAPNYGNAIHGYQYFAPLGLRDGNDHPLLAQHLQEKYGIKIVLHHIEQEKKKWEN